jgi:oligopeptide/dipeptide ABC transporter ATP-binding protein
VIGQSILNVKGLSKRFKIRRGEYLHAVDGVSLDIQENEIVGLVGESGCGKSTLGRTIVGLYDKSAGEVVYQGQTLPTSYGAEEFRKFSREIQMIFQDPSSSLNPRMTIREIVAEGPLIHGIWTRDDVSKKVGAWLERVGLSRDVMSRYPHEFSGGQRQRIGIARALALEPKVVVCDEPISALDVSVQAQVVNLLQDLKQEFGLTLLFIAHDLSMVRYISDRMAVMYLGNIVELGAADDVFYRPLHPYTQALIAANPKPDPKTERVREAMVVKGEIPSPIEPSETRRPGCRFAGRCPKAMEVCKGTTPEWKEVAKNHFVACHLY